MSGHATGTVDVLRLARTHARFVRVRITASNSTDPPLLDELTLDR